MSLTICRYIYRQATIRILFSLNCIAKQTIEKSGEDSFEIRRGLTPYYIAITIRVV